MKKILNICILLLSLVGCFNNKNSSNNKSASNQILVNNVFNILDANKEEIVRIEFWDQYGNFPFIVLEEKKHLDKFISIIDVDYSIQKFDLEVYELEFYLFTMSLPRILLFDNTYEKDYHNPDYERINYPIIYVYKNKLYIINDTLDSGEVFVSNKAIRVEELYNYE